MTCLFDKKALKALKRSDNMLVPWYLMASYAYYVLDTPLISDSLFDTICYGLSELWDDIEHMHKDRIDINDLSAGTRMSTEYPSMTKGAACALLGVPYVVEPGLSGAITALGLAVDSLRVVVHACR